MYSLAGCKKLPKGACEAVSRSWRVDLNGVNNESPRREYLVSYLAVPGLPRRIEDADDEATRKTLSLVRRFTQHYGRETPGGTDEPACFDDGCSGTGAPNIVRARPIDPQSGSVPLVLELLDLLHIQLECLADERIVRGAVAIDGLQVGPNGDGVPSGPALSRVREMEAHGAVFPRIAVAKEIVSRLRSDESLWTADHFLRAEVDLVDCMLCGDGSGGHYIDYLKAGLGEFDYDFDRYAAFLGHHKRIVESGLAGTFPWSTPGTCDRLKRYHNARIDDDLTGPDGIALADECGRGMAGALTPLRIA